MKSFIKYLAVMALALLAFASVSQAQNSNTVQVQTTLTIPESVSATVTPNSVTLTNTTPSATVVVTTGWQVAQGHTTATLFAWWSAVPSCGSCGGSLIAGDFGIQWNGAAYTLCDKPDFGTGFGVAGNNCSTHPLSGINVGTDLNDSIGTNLTIIFNPTNNPGLFPTVGSYTGGVLNILFVVS